MTEQAELRAPEAIEGCLRCPYCLAKEPTYLKKYVDNRHVRACSIIHDHLVSIAVNAMPQVADSPGAPVLTKTATRKQHATAKRA